MSGEKRSVQDFRSVEGNRILRVIGLVAIISIIVSPANAEEEITSVDYRIRLVERLAKISDLGDAGLVSSILQSKLNIGPVSQSDQSCKNLCYKLRPSNQAVARYVEYRVRNVAGQKFYPPPFPMYQFMSPLSEIVIHLGHKECLRLEKILGFLSGTKTAGPAFTGPMDGPLPDFISVTVSYQHQLVGANHASYRTVISFGYMQDPIKPCVEDIVLQEFSAS